MAIKKQQGKQQGKQYTESYHIYGIRKTRNPKYYTLSIVRGSDENREFASIVLKAGDVAQAKDGRFYVGNIKLLEPKKDEKTDDVEPDTIPWSL